MEESKNAAQAAKGFMAMYFAVKQPNPLKSDILDSIFPPNNQQGNAVYESPNVHNSAPADGNSQDSHSKSQGTYQKASGSDFIDDSDPCFMSSSVDYGCRVYYPSSKQHAAGYDMDFTDGNSQDSRSKSQGTYQKASGSDFNDASDPCYMSSAVDYGCRDYYPSSKQHPGGYDTDFADGNSQDSRSKSQGTYQKASGSVFIDASDPCYMSSSVDYGCRDYYPSYKQHPGGYDIDEDRKDGYDYPDPENSRGEWWQGSLYY